MFELELGAGSIASKDELAYLHQFILHSSLDMVDNSMWVNSATFLRVVDRFNHLYVSAYVTPGGAYLLLLHEGRTEDAVRGFMTEMHELYVRYMINPFATLDGPICSPQFESHVRQISRRYLSL